MGNSDLASSLLVSAASRTNAPADPIRQPQRMQPWAEAAGHGPSAAAVKVPKTAQASDLASEGLRGGGLTLVTLVAIADHHHRRVFNPTRPLSSLFTRPICARCTPRLALLIVVGIFVFDDAGGAHVPPALGPFSRGWLLASSEFRHELETAT